jgi:hypothetical protein
MVLFSCDDCRSYAEQSVDLAAMLVQPATQSCEFADKHRSLLARGGLR